MKDLDSASIEEIGEVVYVIQAEGTDLFKIGRSGNVTARKGQLQTGCPHNLDVVGTLEGDAIRIEHDLHEMFAEYRTTGEWFEIPNHWEIRRLFRSDKEKDERAIQYIVVQATQLSVSIHCGTFYDQHSQKYVLRFQLVPTDIEHPFYAYFLKEAHSIYSFSPVQAAATWIETFSQWPDRTSWLKKVGETCFVSQNKLVDGISCPNCRWPICVRGD